MNNEQKNIASIYAFFLASVLNNSWFGRFRSTASMGKQIRIDDPQQLAVTFTLVVTEAAEHRLIPKKGEASLFFALAQMLPEVNWNTLRSETATNN